MSEGQKGVPMKKIVLYGIFSPDMAETLERSCPAGFAISMAEPGRPSELAQADYMIVRAAVVDQAVLDAAPHVRLIQKWGSGYNRIDVRAAGQRGIPVAVCVGGNSLPVAELTVALMLDVLRNVVPMSHGMKNGAWDRERFISRSYLLSGKTVGLVGAGHVSQKVAAILRNGFGCPILYCDIRALDPRLEKALGMSRASLDALMARSDLVSVHVPLLESTIGMIDRRRLELMKPTACLINTSRGGVVCEDDLIAVLKEKRILGAGLDTFSTEPLPRDSELLKLDCVTVTPHCGGNTADNHINMAVICMENIARYDASGGRSMGTIVNREFLPPADYLPKFDEE